MIGGIGAVGRSYEPYSYSPISRDVQTNIDDPIKGTTGKSECQTCKNRKYVDGSDEMVSYKAPTKISANSAAGKVAAHEQEHVANAYSKAATKGGKVLQASVCMKMAVCPECGRSYVAGGTTTTRIAYPKDDPYSKNFKSYSQDATKGGNFDAAV